MKIYKNKLGLNDLKIQSQFQPSSIFEYAEQNIDLKKESSNLNESNQKINNRKLKN